MFAELAQDLKAVTSIPANFKNFPKESANIKYVRSGALRFRMEEKEAGARFCDFGFA